MRRALVAGALALAGCAAPGPAEIGEGKALLVICPGPDTVEGIDVSHWQGTIDWDAVAGSDVEFAFIRVSHGTGTMDREFARNWPEARRVGLIRGVYQFFSAGDDPTAQADLLVDAIGGALEPGDLPPVLDVEGMSLDGQPASTVIANMRTWIARVEARLGVRPIVYTAKYFWRDQLGDPDFTEHPLWVAHYGVTCPDAPSPWTEWRFWQYTSTGSVAGIGGNVDRNVFDGTLADLMAFTGAAPECGDGWCNGGETPDTCAADCPVCRTIPSLGRDVDESELCFERGGTPSYWREEAVGWESSLIWTHTTDDAAADNYGVWSLTFDEAGRYRIEAYTAAGFAMSTQAGYQVRHDGVEETFVVDQSAVDGWSLVGEAGFAAGGDQWVRLEDDTGEPVSGMTRIAFDAIRLTRLDPPVIEDGGAPRDDAAVPSVDGGVAMADAAAPGVDAGSSPPIDAGCGCRAIGRAGASAPWWIALALLAARRRRVRRR